jgi:hypothetical protein
MERIGAAVGRLQKILIIALPVGIGLGIAGVLLFSKSGAPGAAPSASPTATLGVRLDAVRTSGRGRKELPPPEIDLLDLVRIERDAVQGPWGFHGEALVTPAVQWSRLALPCNPPEEYDLRIIATRRQGTDSLNIGFVYGGRQGMLMLDGNGGETSWIDLLTPYDLPSNETAVVGKFLKWNRATRILLSVRRHAVNVSIDGAKIIDWKGDPAELKLIPGYRIPDRQALFIGSWDTILAIDELALIPITGKALLHQ